MFPRTASLASIVALAAIFAPPALAACDNDERPPVPFGMKAAPKNGATSSAIFFSWRWEFTRKVDRVCWDIEITDGAGKIVRSGAGTGPCVSARNRFTVPFTLDDLAPGTKRCMRVRARTEPGTQGCVSPGWTAVACATTTEDVKARACTNYANRAVGTAKLARDTYKCNPATISGPRWTASFEEHRRWCISAPAATANFEDRERARIAQECRIAAAKGPSGSPKIVVTSRAGDTFFVNGSGFPPNVPIVIRLSGPAASIANVTVANNQRIIADAKGSFSVRLFGAQICKRGGGNVVFTAEDQDGRKSPAATAKCAP